MASAAALAADLLLVTAHVWGERGVWVSAAVGCPSLAAVALGYVGVARLLEGRARRLLRGVAVGVGVVAPWLHGVTALVIAATVQDHPGVPVPPAVSFGPMLPRVLWTVVGVLGVVGSVVFGLEVWRGRTGLPRGMVAWTPLSLAVLTSVVGLLTPWPDVLAVLSGNVAQLGFFAALLASAPPGTPRPG